MTECSLKKFEYRSIIKFLCKEGVNAKEIFDRLSKVYTSDAPSYATVTRWFAEFKHGRQSIEDDPKCGGPKTATDAEHVAQVESLILANRRLKVSEIAQEIGISQGSVYNIIHTNLHMSKVSARWVPRNLSIQDKHCRMEASRELLDLFNSNPDDFMARLVTGDETWLHHWDPETKQESMQWKHAESPAPKKFKTQASAGKIMASVFWDCQGLLLIDYMPHKTTINAEYYAQLLKKLRSAIKEKRRGKLSKGIFLLHDNAPVHKARVAQAALKDCGFEQLNHPPYSPDLAPSDFYLFRNLKKYLRGRRFRDDEELKEETEAWFAGQEETFFFRGIASLKEKWGKCIELRGNYIEK